MTRTRSANPAVERMRASRSGQFIFLAHGRLARTAHRRRSPLESMDFFQVIIAIPWFAGGVFIWPGFLTFRSSADPRAPQLRRIFVVTFAALGAVGVLLAVVALLGRFNHNWLPVTLLFPLINLVSIVLSVGILRHERTG